MTGPKESPNRTQLESVARRMGPLLDEVVFVGGQVAELLVTDPAATRVRPTEDVDVVVGITTRTAYHAFGERLRGLGFREDTRPRAPLCRWRAADDLLLDVMPINGDVLGFTNPWYRAVLDTAVRHSLTADLSIRISAAPAYLATKWAAFDSRGGGDHVGSHDIEDIVTVVAGRTNIVADVGQASASVAGFLSERTGTFLVQPDAVDAIEGALPDARFDPTLIARVRRRLEEIERLASR